MVDQAKAFYFFPDADVYGGSGVYLLNPGAEYYSTISVNVLKYPRKGDIHIYWYTAPKEAGGPVWLPPHPNYNIEYAMHTVTYAMPIYKDGSFLGVMGMDVSMSLLRRIIDNLQYETAFDANLAAFNRENEQYEEELAISKGAAVFDRKLDKDYRAAFSRADEAMYACKAEYYRIHGDRRRLH